MQSKKPIVIVDKGIKNFDARVIATLMYKGISEDEAIEMVEQAKLKFDVHSLEDKDLFFKLRKVTGMKGERVRFWKSISGSVLKSANKCKIDMHRNKKRQGPKYKLYNIPSNAYMCNAYASVEYVYVIINQEFLEKQIGIAKDVIVKFDEMINEYWLFVKKIVTTEDII